MPGPDGTNHRARGANACIYSPDVQPVKAILWAGLLVPGFRGTWVVLSNVAGKAGGVQSATPGALGLPGVKAVARIQKIAGLAAGGP